MTVEGCPHRTRRGRQLDSYGVLGDRRRGEWRTSGEHPLRSLAADADADADAVAVEVVLVGADDLDAAGG